MRTMIIIAQAHLIIIPQQRLHTVTVCTIKISISILESCKARTVRVDALFAHVRRSSLRSKITQSATLVVEIGKSVFRMIRSHVIDGVAGWEFLISTIRQIRQIRRLVVVAIIVVIILPVKFDVVTLLDVLKNRRWHVDLVLMLVKIRRVGDVWIGKWIR